MADTWKLDASDASFVDVIHTNVGVFGKVETTGHADFYVNGGTTQKACAGMKRELYFLPATAFIRWVAVELVPYWLLTPYCCGWKWLRKLRYDFTRAIFPILVIGLHRHNTNRLSLSFGWFYLHFFKTLSPHAHPAKDKPWLSNTLAYKLIQTLFKYNSYLQHYHCHLLMHIISVKKYQ